jgi:hypothetical protein
MTTSIPASQLVNVVPSVLGAGGSPLSLNAVFLTEDPSIPVGTVQPFATYADVAAWFGAMSNEAQVALVYFAGFSGANTLPGLLYFAQFNTTNVSGYLRGGSVAAVTLAQLQAITGVLDVTIDGEAVISSAINLSAATSFSNAASLITTALDTATGVFSGTANQTASATVMTVTAVASGALHVGDVITGTGVDAGLHIISFGTGTGGTGTYNVSTTTGFTSTAIDVATGAQVTFDPQREAFVVSSATTGANSSVGFASGSIAPYLNLTLATGAVRSAGAVAATPAALMNGIVAITQNFATFMTVVEQVLSIKLALAAWVTAQNDRYLFVVPDSDPTVLAANASASFGVLTAAYDGVAPVYDNSGQSLIGAFVCGAAASIDFSEVAGRITFAYKGQPGLAAQITSATQAQNLISNGYNFYGAYATANQGFVMLQPGQMSGSWKWIDAYVNEIFLNSQLQLALLELLTNAKSIPYNPAGYNLIRAGCLGSIKQALSFGAIQPGVDLSPAQVAAVNTAAGVAIDQTLQNSGWYLQVLDPGAVVRGQRGSPACTFFYTDGGAIHKINLASVDIA